MGDNWKGSAWGLGRGDDDNDDDDDDDDDDNRVKLEKASQEASKGVPKDFLVHL